MLTTAIVYLYGNCAGTTNYAFHQNYLLHYVFGYFSLNALAENLYMDWWDYHHCFLFCYDGVHIRSRYSFAIFNMVYAANLVTRKDRRAVVGSDRLCWVGYRRLYINLTCHWSLQAPVAPATESCSQSDIHERHLVIIHPHQEAMSMLTDFLQRLPRFSSQPSISSEATSYSGSY